MSIRVSGGTSGGGNYAAPAGTYATGALGYTIDEPGRYIPAGWGASLSAGLAASLTSAVDLLALFGDSTTYGQVNVGPEPYPWSQWVRSLLVKAGFPDGGLGAYTFPASSTDNGVSLTGLSNHRILDGAGTWGGALSGAAYQFLPSWSLSFATTTNPDSKTFYFTTDKMRLFYLKASAYSTGTFTHSLNGAAAVTVDATIGSGVDYGVVTLSGTKGSLNTLKVTNTSAACQVALDAYNNVGPVIHTSGIPSLTMSTRFDITGVPSPQPGNAIALGLAAGLAASSGSLSTNRTGPRQPAAAVLYLGINDQQGSTTLALATAAADNISASIAIYADSCRTAGTDPIVVIPHLNYANHSEYRGVIERGLLAAARANGCAVFDAGYALGYGAVQTTYQSGGGHLNKLGYQTVAAAFVNKMLKPFFPATGLTPVLLPPAARMTASATTGNTPLSVTLDASASYVNETGATITSYTFDSGDGQSVTQAGATKAFTYSTAGTWSPKVTVTDSNGKSATLTLPSALSTTAVTYLVTDTFTAADNTLLSAHTADTGQSAVGSTSSHKIVSNRLTYISGGNDAAWDAGATGKIASVDFIVSGNGSVGVIAAYIDSSNYVCAFWDNGTFKLYTRVAGTGTFGTSGSTVSMASGTHTVTAQVTGGNLVATCDGTTVLTVALSSPQLTAVSGYTKYGIFGGGTPVEDNFHVLA